MRGLSRAGLLRVNGSRRGGWFFPLRVNRDPATDKRAPSRRFKIERGADEIGAIMHNAKADAGALVLHGWKRKAVIANREENGGAVPGKPDVNFVRLCMAYGVGDGFLRDFVDLLNSVLRQGRNSAIRPKNARDVEHGSDLPREVFEGQWQAFFMNIQSGQMPRHVFSVIHGIGEQPVNLAGALGLLGSFLFEIEFEAFEHEADAGQPLAKIVM